MIPTHSLKHTPSLPFHRQRHTPEAPAITLGPQATGSLTWAHPQSPSPSQGGLHLRTQPGRGDGVQILQRPRVQQLPAHSLQRWGGLSTLLPPSPSTRWLCHYAPPPPVGPGSSAQTPGLGCEVGEGRGGGGGSSERDTKRRPSASAPWRRWGGGSVRPIPPSPPAGLGASVATHLGPASLGWGRGDAAAGGLGAVSVSFGPARGGLRAPQPWAGMRRAPRGLGRPGPGALGGPRGLLLVRGSSRCPRFPRFGVPVYRNWGVQEPAELGAF